MLNDNRQDLANYLQKVFVTSALRALDVDNHDEWEEDHMKPSTALVGSCWDGDVITSPCLVSGLGFLNLLREDSEWDS